MRVHYKRVSTIDQRTDRQESILIGLKVYEDKCSGSVPFKERLRASELINKVELGLIKEVHVHSIDRLGRSTINIMQTIQYFTSKGVNVISTKEGFQTLNSDGSENMIAKMLVGILGTLAEFELSRMKERQTEGIAKAKGRGVYKSNGRPKGSKESILEFLNKPKARKVHKELLKGRSIRETALVSACSAAFVQKVKKFQDFIENGESDYIDKFQSGFEYLEK